jgi:hypothetical protein
LVRWPSAAGATPGQQGRALGRSKGGISWTIHLEADFDGLPIVFHLTGPEIDDRTQLRTTPDIGPDMTPRAAIDDMGYNSAKSFAICRKRRSGPEISHRRDLEKPIRHLGEPRCKTRGHR